MVAVAHSGPGRSPGAGRRTGEPDENAAVRHAFNQFQTYKLDILGLFTCSKLLAISDGLEARLGTLTADREQVMP